MKALLKKLNLSVWDILSGDSQELFDKGDEYIKLLEIYRPRWIRLKREGK